MLGFLGTWVRDVSFVGGVVSVFFFKVFGCVSRAFVVSGGYL